jgi:hypothetical protein
MQLNMSLRTYETINGKGTRKGRPYESIELCLI